MAAIGTTTLVCDGEAVAFGHPFLFAGPTLLGATRANVFAIVDDDAFGPYKLAAPTEPIGIVDRDRLAGIRGVLGAEIPTIPIVQDTVALDTGRTRLDGRTEVVDNEAGTDFFLPEAVLTHAFANTDSTFDQIGAGSARLAWTVNGVNERSGKPFELVRTNRFTSRSDITADALFELYMGINSLTAQDLAPVTFAGIELDMEVESTVREWHIGEVKWAVGNEPFRDVKKIRANPKQRIRARVPLEASDTGRARLVKLQFRAPNRPRLGEIRISGGGRGGGFFIEDLFCALFGLCPKDKQETFRDLLRELANKPRNDELLADLRFGRKSSKVLRPQNRVVAGRDSVKVIMGEERPGPGLPPLPS
jgi:hypothetical protein